MVQLKWFEMIYVRNIPSVAALAAEYLPWPKNLVEACK